MYTHSAGITGAAAATGTGLAFTGIDVTYAVCAAFALLAAGMALVRIAPRIGRAR